MITISLCMIVKNEEDVLARCLDSIADLVDEIIIVDTGSTDNTKNIAQKYTNNVLDFKWIDNFAKARNYAFSFAKSEYSMWLDADDILSEDDRVKFLELKNTLSPNISVVMLPYNTGFDNDGNIVFSYYRERLIKNNQGMIWVGAVHEVINPIGEIFYGKPAISHKKLHQADPDRNLMIFESELAKGVSLDPRQQFYYARELYYHKRYNEAIMVLEFFLQEDMGWLENKIDAHAHLSYCYYNLGEEQKALESLLHTFTLDTPRAEICCDIAKHFFDRESWRKSAYWYTIALTCKRDDSRGGFTSPDCYGYLPCIQLCVCYSKLGEIKKAIRFNNLAGEQKPNSDAVKHNREYFNRLEALLSEK